MHDEPKGRDFPGLAGQVAGIRKAHPTALSFINLLGYVNISAADTMSLYGFPTYEECVGEKDYPTGPSVIADNTTRDLELSSQLPQHQRSLELPSSTIECC